MKTCHMKTCHMKTCHMKAWSKPVILPASRAVERAERDRIAAAKAVMRDHARHDAYFRQPGVREAAREKFYADFERAHDPAFLASAAGRVAQSQAALETRAALGAPGHDGQFESGVRAIDNPLATHKYEAGTAAFTRKTHVAAVNMRETPIAYWHARKIIGDAELLAADRMRVLFEASEEGLGAVDPGRVQVDGGGGGMMLSERRAHAAKVLAMLGHEGVISSGDRELLRQACQAGRRVADIVDEDISSSDQKAYRKVVLELICRALRRLVRHWHLERKGIRAKRAGRAVTDESQWEGA